MDQGDESVLLYPLAYQYLDFEWYTHTYWSAIAMLTCLCVSLPPAFQHEQLEGHA